jgi:uncharacterized alpha-E superfamily protein
MILLNSNAEHIFWLGRYISRTQYLCQSFPFQQDDLAVTYAQAFYLPAFDAISLNELVLDANQSASFSQQFNYMKNNIHELRGVLSAKGYAELGQLIKLASENPGYICDVVRDCSEIFEAEVHDVFLFFKLGQMLEQLDRQLRLEQNITETLADLAIIVEQLKGLGWRELDEVWDDLKNQLDQKTYYKFSEYIQNMFEAAL